MKKQHHFIVLNVLFNMHFQMNTASKTIDPAKIHVETLRSIIAFQSINELNGYIKNHPEAQICINKYTSHGITLLNHAINCNKPSIVKQLLNLGANSNLKNIITTHELDTHHFTPLINAVRQADIESIKALIKAGADININQGIEAGFCTTKCEMSEPFPHQDKNPLSYAIKLYNTASQNIFASTAPRYKEIIIFLLQQEASINVLVIEAHKKLLPKEYAFIEKLIKTYRPDYTLPTSCNMKK